MHASNRETRHMSIKAIILGGFAQLFNLPPPRDLHARSDERYFTWDNVGVYTVIFFLKTEFVYGSDEVFKRVVIAS